MKTHVVLGAGQAGACAAVAMRKAGFEGRIVLIGDEPGLPYERPPLSKDVLLAVSPSPPVIYSEDDYGNHAIETRFGVRVTDAEGDSNRLSLSNGESVTFDKMLIATGGRARRLSIPGGELALPLRTSEDAQALRPFLNAKSRVICIGAGVIGMELAAVARLQGCDVVVVEVGSAVMARAFTPDMQQYIENKHRTAGVSFLFGARPQSLEKLSDGSIRLHLEDGTSLDGDVVVAGVGMDRNIEIARQLGIDFDNGILVNEFGQSSRADVFAAGDVAAFWHPGWGQHLRLEAWRHAINHGIAVGQNMCGKDVVYSDVPWFWTDQYDLHIQVFGIPQASSRTLYRRGAKEGSFIVYHLDDEDILVGTTTINDPRGGRAAQTLIQSKSKLPDALAADSSGVPLWI